MVNLDANYLRELVQEFTFAAGTGSDLPAITNAVAARLSHIADNIDGLDRKAGGYAQGFQDGQQIQRARSNILAEDKETQRKRLRAATRGVPVKRSTPDLDLEGLGL